MKAETSRTAVTRRIDPVTLRLFVAVVDSGTISAAAESENIAASAVSRRLSDLELHLKTQLLQRSNRGIETTIAGRELLALARNALNDLDNIYCRMKEHADGEKSLLRILASVSAVEQFLPFSLSSFSTLYPDVDIRVEEKLSAQVLEGVAAGAADLGLYVHAAAGTNVDALGLASLPYRSDELVVVAPVNHPLSSCKRVTARETFQYPYVGLAAGSQINQMLIVAAQDVGASLMLKVKAASFASLGQMVAANVGIALVPKLIGQRFALNDEVRCMKFDEPWAQREIRICARAINSLPRSATRFIEHLCSDTSNQLLGGACEARLTTNARNGDLSRSRSPS